MNSASLAKALKRIALVILGCFVLGIYVPILAVLYSPLYTGIVLHASRQPSEMYKTSRLMDAPREEYFFDSSGTKLHGWLFRKPGSNVVVIVHHGNAGNVLDRLLLAGKFIEAGTSVFLYDYSGFGKSAGSPSVSGILNDGVAAFDFVKGKFENPIMINCGESIGSSVACHVNCARPANALILISGIASLPMIAQDKLSILKMYPDIVWPRPLFDNRALLAQSKIPVLLIHGDLDVLVLPIHSRLLLNSAASSEKKLVTLPGCGHNDVGINDQELFQDTITDFVARHGLKPQAP